MPIDYTKIKKKINGQIDPFEVDPLTLRVGVVAAVNSNGTANITLSGVTLTNVPVLATGQNLITGLPVQVVTYRGSFLVLGHVAGTNTPAGRKYVIKGADQNLTNTTMTDITGMSIPLEANASYAYQAFFAYAGNQAGDIKLAFTGPAGFSMSRYIVAPQLGSTSNINTAVTMIRRSAGTAQEAGATGTGDFTNWLESGIIRTGSTAGSAQVQAAQQTSSANATIFRNDSYMFYERIED